MFWFHQNVPSEAQRVDIGAHETVTAWSGVSTIGSFSLKLVFNTIGSRMLSKL